jgi:hypothetical protein
MTRFRDEKKNNQNELKHQIAFVEWFTYNHRKLRRLLTVSSVGDNIGSDKMAKLLKMGLTPGWPDLFLAVPKRLDENKPIICPGLFIEMKDIDGRLSAVQKEIHQELKGQGYQVSTCQGWDEAKEVVEEYLK